LSQVILEVDGLEMYIPAIDSEKKKRNLVASPNLLFMIDNIQKIIVKTNKILKIAYLKLFPEKSNVEINLKSIDRTTSEAIKSINIVEVKATTT